MTTFDRFDPFERRIGEALDGLAPLRRPEYLDDILQGTARSSQRPRWTFLERWLPVDTTLARPMLFGRAVPMRALIALVALAALVASAAVYVGSQHRVPPPYGLADNGRLVFSMDGDLYVADGLGQTPRLLLAAPDAQQGVVLSPDGRLVAYDNFTGTAGPDAGEFPYAWVVNLDGSNPRQVLDVPYTYEAFEWAPDSRSMVLVTKVGPVPHLYVAPADGSGARDLQFEAFVPWGATWDPARAGVLLVRGQDRDSKLTDLYYVNTDGAVLQAFGLQPLNLNGAPYELSGAVFSPDGQTIAYNAIVAEEPPVNRFRARLLNRDGTNDREIPAPFATNFSQAWPAFSPDGKWVLLSSWQTMANGSVVHRLAIAPADGSAAARLIGPVVDSENQLKTWSPDGTRILLCACDGSELYSVDPITGDSERIAWSADLPGWQRLAR